MNDTKQIGQDRKIALDEIPPDVRAKFFDELVFEYMRDIFNVPPKIVEQPIQPPEPPKDSGWKFWKR